MSTKYADYRAGEDGAAGDESRFKMQKSPPGREHMETFGRIVTLEQDEPIKAQDEADTINTIEKIDKDFSNLVCHQTAETVETSKQNESDDEVFENNIEIGNSSSQIEDGGIPVGVHVKKAEQGYRVHRIISGGHIHKSPLRENDVIIRVNDTNIGSLSFEEFKEFFWKIRVDIDATIKVTIIRRVDDENEADSGFVTETFSIHLNVEEEDSNSIKGWCCKPDIYNITIHYGSVEDKYLCVENDIPIFLPMEEQRPKFQWKMQKCDGEKDVYFLLCNFENDKYLICADENDGSKVLKMRKGTVVSPYTTVSSDRRWFQRDDYDPESGKFSLQPVQCKGWYLTVNGSTEKTLSHLPANTPVLTITDDAKARQYFVRHEVLHKDLCD